MRASPRTCPSMRRKRRRFAARRLGSTATAFRLRSMAPQPQAASPVGWRIRYPPGVSDIGRPPTGQAPASVGARAKQTEGAGVAVQKRRALHGADLPVAEEAAERHGAEMPPKRVGIVVGPAVEVLASAETRE